MIASVDTGEPWSKDRMSRRGIAKFITHYLDSNPKIKVLNINSPWGAGKTFFLENWRAEQASSRACVYFNAWENDFAGDPFVSLVAAIREQLGSVIGLQHNAEDLIRGFTKKASKTLIAATPALAKGVLKKFTGVDVGVISEVVDNDALVDAAEKAVEKLIERNQEALSVVEDFKSVFHDLIQLSSRTVADGGGLKPVYIFIDELDRCRPTFAIELLERVKHLFDVGGCKFIIATDTAQLSHSIRAVYGAGFGSDKYLKRFFDAEFTLDNSDFGAWIKANCVDLDGTELVGLNNALDLPRGSFYDEKRSVEPGKDTVLSGEHNLNEHQAVVLALAKTFKSKLRELEKIVMQIGAVRANAMVATFHFFWAAYLVFLKDEAPDLYEKAIRGDWKQAMEEVNQRYPAYRLYFVVSNVSVHEIFSHYVALYRGGEAEANSYVRNMSGGELHYIQKANLDFSNSYRVMSKYPVLVDLAHSIE